MRPGILPVPDGKASGVTTSVVLAFCGRLLITDSVDVSFEDADGEEGGDDANGSSACCGCGAAAASGGADEEATALLSLSFPPTISGGEYRSSPFGEADRVVSLGCCTRGVEEESSEIAGPAYEDKGDASCGSSVAFVDEDSTGIVVSCSNFTLDSSPAAADDDALQSGSDIPSDAEPIDVVVASPPGWFPFTIS